MNSSSAESWCRTWPLETPGMSEEEIEATIFWYLKKRTQSVSTISLITGIPRVEVQRAIINMMMNSVVRGTGVWDRYRVNEKETTPAAPVQVFSN